MMPGRGNPAPGHGFKGGVSPPRPSPTPAPSPFPAPGLRVRLAVWGAWSLPHGHTLPCRGALGSWERRLLSLVTAPSHPVCVPGLCDVTHPPGWGGLAGGNRLSAPFLCFRPGRHLPPVSCGKAAGTLSLSRASPHPLLLGKPWPAPPSPPRSGWELLFRVHITTLHPFLLQWD